MYMTRSSNCSGETSSRARVFIGRWIEEAMDGNIADPTGSGCWSSMVLKIEDWFRRNSTLMNAEADASPLHTTTYTCGFGVKLAS